MKHWVYADHAATTKLDTDAFEAMKPYLLEEYGNASQPYSFARSAKKALKEARETIAKCIGAEPEEIIFTSGGTESDNWAIKGIAYAGKKHHVITSSIEHHAVLRACEEIDRMGYPVTYLPVDYKGVVTEQSLSTALRDDTCLVSIMTANNEIGTIQNIAGLTMIAHSHGALFHTDAVQAVGHIPIDVKKLGVDMLSSSAHKFNGPKGIGFLYVRKGTQLIPYANGGSQEFGMRAGTENIASIVGMALALKKNIAVLEQNEKHLYGLENELVSGLHNMGISFVRNGNMHNHVPGNISLSFPGFEGEALLHSLDLMGICVSTGSACDSKETQISHVLKAIGLEEKAARGTIRISLGKDNTSEDVEIIISALGKVLQ